jgi:hypothetical protein
MVGAVLVAVAAPGVANADICGVGGPVGPGAPGGPSGLGGPGDCGAVGDNDTSGGGHPGDTPSAGDSSWPPGAGDYGSDNGSASAPAAPIVTPVHSAP